MKEPPVLVVGGGIIGCLTAYELAKAGLPVRLIEKNKIGTGSCSANSAAMLELQIDAYRNEPFYSLAKASHDLFPALAADLKKDGGVDIQFERNSILQLAMSTAEAKTLEAECARQVKLGLKAEWLSKETVSKRFKEIHAAHFGAAHFLEDGQVHAQRFLEAAFKAAKAKGVDVQENVTDFLLTDVSPSTKVVVAAGAWTDEVLKPIHLSLGIIPIRGQLVVYETKNDRPVPFPVYTSRAGYVTPRRDGTTLAGTTVEEAGFDGKPTPDGRKKIISLLENLMPHLLQFPNLTMTAGLRPKSQDELPIIGPLPEHSNIVIAAGHYRNGILLAPITAKICAALIAGRALPVSSITPFSPARVFSRA